MRLPKRWYGIFVCLLVTAFVWIYVQVRVPGAQKYDAILNLAADFIPDKAVTSTPGEHSDPLVTTTGSRQTQPTEPIDKTGHPAAVPAKTNVVRKHIIFVVSYMRSGSTLTADIMQHYPATVYTFEPLHMITRRAMEGKRLYYLDGTWKNVTVQDITIDFMKSEMDKWINCRYNELDIYTLTDIYHLQFSAVFRKLAACWNHNNRTLNAISKCLPDVIQRCQKAKTLLFKFIRLPMQLVHDIYSIYPNLQVIHLIRDPRGSLVSQNNLGKFTWDETNQFSKSFCERVATDINVTVRLNYYDHDRAKVLLYEHLAMNPIKTASNIFRFLHQPHSNRLLNYISDLTMKGRRNSIGFGIVRSNSTATAFAWRDKIRLNESTMIDGNCQTVYDFFGYKRFSEIQQLRDHSLHTLVPTNLSLLKI